MNPPIRPSVPTKMSPHRGYLQDLSQATVLVQKRPSQSDSLTFLSEKVQGVYKKILFSMKTKTILGFREKKDESHQEGTFPPMRGGVEVRFPSQRWP
jgi:hypothetical protein